MSRREREVWGRIAETVAAWSLRLKGYRILARRFKTPLGELDLVARRGQLVAFIEVKARTDLDQALTALGPRQRERTARAAELFLLRHPGHAGCTLRFDLIAVRPLAWPGAVHEGRGEVQLIVDERADERQRDAILKIASGEETEPMATFFNVFASTMEKVHDPLFLPIEFEIDIPSRTGRARIPGILELAGEPITNPVSGAPHQARVTLPHGFEYHEAEFGSSTVKATGSIQHDWFKGHAHLCMLHLNAYGPIRN